MGLVTEGGLFAQGTPSLVRFVRRRGDALEAAYDVPLSGGWPPVAVVPDGRQLTPDQEAQFRARALALAHLDDPCPGAYVPIAFRDEGASDWVVYLLAGTTARDRLMLGGHFRFLVSADGHRLISAARLSPGCRSQGVGPTVEVAEDLSPVPTEIQFFASMWWQTPLLVTASDGTWLIEHGLASPVPAAPQ